MAFLLDLKKESITDQNILGECGEKKIFFKKQILLLLLVN